MAMHLRGEGRIMNTTYNTKTKRLIAALEIAAAAAVAPALLFAGAGTAQADDVCYPAYDQGYLDGSAGGIGRCYQDQSQQSLYDSGFVDGQAGRQPNPPNSWIPQIPVNSPTYEPNGPQTTMGPWDGTTGSGLPESPEFPEYHEPLEPFTPPEQPWEQMEPPAID
jgi:hypothetical protein